MPIKLDEDMENSHENNKGTIAILLLQRDVSVLKPIILSCFRFEEWAKGMFSINCSILLVFLSLCKISEKKLSTLKFKTVLDRNNICWCKLLVLIKILFFLWNLILKNFIFYLFW